MATKLSALDDRISDSDWTNRDGASTVRHSDTMPCTNAGVGYSGPWDVSDNVRGGLAYLRWLLAYYQGDVRLAVAAYNAGEKAVDKYGGIPPYPETQSYVRRVVSLYGSDTHPYAPVVQPSPAIKRP